MTEILRMWLLVVASDLAFSLLIHLLKPVFGECFLYPPLLLRTPPVPSAHCYLFGPIFLSISLGLAQLVDRRPVQRRRRSSRSWSQSRQSLLDGSEQLHRLAQSHW